MGFVKAMLISIVAISAVSLCQAAIVEDWSGDNGDPWPAKWTREAQGSVTMGAYDIQNGQGRCQSDNTNSQHVSYVNLAGAVALDSEQLVKFMVTNNIPEGGLIARRADGNADTFYGVEVGGTRFDDLEIFTMVDGSYSRLYEGGDGSQIPTNTWHWMRFKVTQNGGATDLQVRIWPDGTAEPGAWTAEVLADAAADLQNVSGRVGVWYDLGGIGREVRFDDYWTDVPEPATLGLLVLGGTILLLRKRRF